LYVVYALFSKSIDKIYIGQTSNLDARLKNHREYSKGYTVRAKDWEVIYTEEAETRTDARRRETQLKTSGGSRFLRDLIK